MNNKFNNYTQPFVASQTRRGFFQNALFIGLLLLFSSPSFGQTYYWTGAVSSDWFTAGNWNTNAVPNNTSTVAISAATFAPVINGGTATATGVYLEGNVGPASLTIANSGVLNITLHRLQNTSSNCLIDNSGTINYMGDGSFSSQIGIQNIGIFNNHETGKIIINNLVSWGTGINNLGTFVNNGNIKIGNQFNVGSIGLRNSGVFYNNNGGIISIDRTIQYGIINTFYASPSSTIYGVFTNASIIKIGELASTGIHGIVNQSNFNNNTGGLITIDRVTTAGISLQSDGSNFNNNATIIVGQLMPVLNIVHFSRGNFFNNSGGSISGSGSINALSFNSNGGKLTPGIMEFIAGSEDFTNSILDIDITGNEGVPGTDYDKIKVSFGSATIGANTLLNLKFSTTTNIGDYYDIITANMVMGTIQSSNINITNIGAANVGEVSVSYPNNNTVRITVTKFDCAITTLPSNLTLSACINQEDYQDWLDNHGGAVLDCNTGNYTWTWKEYDFTTVNCPIMRGWSVRFTVSDANGSLASASATVSIVDEDTPEWTTAPTNLTIPCNATNVDATIKAWLTNAGGVAIFDCGGYTLASNYTVVASNCGATQVTFTATDKCGRSSTATAVLTRDLPPIFSNVPPNTTISCPVTPSFASPTATACGGAATITYTDVTNGAACPAMHIVTRTWVAQDACGNTSSAKSKVTIWPENAPTNTTMTVNCANSFMATAAVGATSAVVNYPVPSGTSTCPLNTVTVTQVTGLASGAVFPLGVSLVTYAITDECDHIRYCSFTVFVQTSPAQSSSNLTLACNDNNVVNATAGTNNAVVTYALPTATTTCVGSVPSVTLLSGLASGAAFPVGVNTVVYKATDACGSTTTCSFTVTVNPAPLPASNGIKLKCSNDVTVVAADGATSAVVNYTAPTGNSVCPMGGFTIVLHNGLASGSAFPIGVSTVTYRATSNCGNEKFCSFTVTVLGVQPLVGNNGDLKEINPDGEIFDDGQVINAQDRNAMIDKNTLSLDAFKIYPNPSSDRLFIESMQLDGLIGAKYEVFDNIRRVVIMGTIVDNLTDLDISRLPVGHFTMRIVASGKSAVLRFEKVN
jgi:hypothetical protein